MARKIDRLTDRTIKAKKEKGYYADGDGLYLQVSATGSKSWVFRFKRDGKARDMGARQLPRRVPRRSPPEGQGSPRAPRQGERPHRAKSRCSGPGTARRGTRDNLQGMRRAADRIQ